MGIESTAHTAGVGIVSPEGEILADRKAVFTPPEGSGIHPREAAQHHVAALPGLVSDAPFGETDPHDVQELYEYLYQRDLDLADPITNQTYAARMQQVLYRNAQGRKPSL